jgi:hypothetical protein
VPAQMEKLKPYLENPEFVPEMVAKANRAAGMLCKWILGIAR